MEDTLHKMENEQNEVLIEDMLRTATPRELEGDLTRNPVIHRGDAELPVPMVVNSISSAGYVTLWDTRTFEPVPVLYYLLSKILRRRRPDGSYRFTSNNPNKLPLRGSIKCMLHIDNPNRDEYDAKGFRECKKSNIPNDFQLRQHMLKKHPQEWKAIDEARKQVIEDEDRELRRALLQAQLGQRPPEPVVFRPTEPEKITVENNQIILPENSTMYFCAECSAMHRYKSKLGKKHLKLRA